MREYVEAEAAPARLATKLHPIRDEEVAHAVAQARVVEVDDAVSVAPLGRRRVEQVEQRFALLVETVEVDPSELEPPEWHDERVSVGVVDHAGYLAGEPLDVLLVGVGTGVRPQVRDGVLDLD